MTLYLYFLRLFPNTPTPLSWLALLNINPDVNNQTFAPNLYRLTRVTYYGRKNVQIKIIQCYVL